MKEVVSIKKQRIDSLQGLRFLAFLGIFISHIGIIDWGPWGVSIFLVLSGFLMTYSYHDRDIPYGIRKQFCFATGKIKKLYPLHIVTMIAAIIVQCVWGVIFYSLKRSIIDGGIVGLHLLLLQSWIPRSGVYFSLNGVSWYLGVIFLCYFLYPVIRGKINRYPSRRNAVQWIIIIYAVQIMIGCTSSFIHVPESVSKDFTKWLTYVCPLFRLGDFAIGCNLGYLYIDTDNSPGSKPVSKSVWSVLELVALSIGLIIPLETLQNSSFEWLAFSIIYLPISVALVWLFSKGKGILSDMMSKKPVVIAGGLTTYAFLIHFQVVNDWMKYTSVGMWLSCLICLIITAVLSGIWKRFVVER